MPDILVVPLFQVSPQAQLLHGKIYYIADRYGESHSRQPALLTLFPAAAGIFAWTGPGVNGSRRFGRFSEWSVERVFSPFSLVILASSSSLVFGSRGVVRRRFNCYATRELAIQFYASVGTDSSRDYLANRCQPHKKSRLTRKAQMTFTMRE